MAPCGSGHTTAHAVYGAVPALSKSIICAPRSRLGLGSGLSSGSKRRTAVSFRTRDEGNAVFEAVPTQPPSKLIAIIDMTQALSIFMVMAIQIGLILRKQTASSGTPTMKISHQISSPTDPLVSLSEHQPFFLAWALACALFARIFTPRKLEIQAKGVATQDLRQKADSVQVKESLRHVERQLSKMQSRVLICAEQFRIIRRASDESRIVTNEVLAQHGNAIAEVQEQANSLQRVLSSLQDVVVKQIEVITPPIKSLNTRVRALESELQQVRDQPDRDPRASAIGATQGDAQVPAVVQPPESAAGGRGEEAAVGPDERSISKVFDSEAGIIRNEGSICAPGPYDDIPPNAAAAHVADDTADISSATLQSHQGAAVPLPAPQQGRQALGGFPGSSGRMMQISWRETASVAVQRDTSIVSDGSSTVQDHRSLVPAAEAEDPQADRARLAGQAAQRMGQVSVSSHELQWSQQERTAMAQRLMDLCRSYDAAAVAGYQPARRSALAAATSTGNNDTLLLGSQSVFPRRADQKWRQMGRVLQPFSLSRVGGVERVNQHEAQAHGSTMGASIVPDGGWKLQVVDVAGSSVQPAGHGQPPNVGGSMDSMERGDPSSPDQGHSDVRLLAEHGLLTLLTCAVTSVVWAAPVV